MVDDPRSFPLPQRPLFRPDSSDDLRGVAALSPQFDIPIPSARRSVTPIGATSPQARSRNQHSSQPCAPQQAHVPSHHVSISTNTTTAAPWAPSLTSFASSLPKSYYPFSVAQPFSRQPHSHSQSQPFSTNSSLYQSSHHSNPSALSHNSLQNSPDFASLPFSAHSVSTAPRAFSSPNHDLCDLSTIDLGPPVVQRAPSPHFKPLSSAISTSTSSTDASRSDSTPPFSTFTHPIRPTASLVQPSAALAVTPPRHPGPRHLPVPLSLPFSSQVSYSDVLTSPSLAAQRPPRSPPSTFALHSSNRFSAVPSSASSVNPPTSSAPLGSPPISLANPQLPSLLQTRQPREPAHPTRCVLVRNLPPGVDDADLRSLLLQFGPLRDMGAQQRARGGKGSVIATYYDLRHARDAVRDLDASLHFGRRLEARFQCPIDVVTSLSSPTSANSSEDSSPPPSSPSSSPAPSPSSQNAPSNVVNHGTLVVFNLDTSTTADDIRALFSAIGDVKEIRATPNKKHHKFVEFYDVRDAERALRVLNKTEVSGKRIKIEISRPGGRANGFVRAPATLSPSAGPLPAPVASPSVPASAPFVSQAQRTPAIPVPIAQDSSSTWRYDGSFNATSSSSFNGPFSLSGDDFDSHADVSHRIEPLNGNHLATSPCLTPLHVGHSSGSFDDKYDRFAASFPPLQATVDSSTSNRRFPTQQCLSSSVDDDECENREFSNLLDIFDKFGLPEEDSSHAPRAVRPGRDSYMQALYHSVEPDRGRNEGSSFEADCSPYKALSGFPSSTINDDDDATTPGAPSSSIDNCTRRYSSITGRTVNGVNKFALDLEKVRRGEETRTALMIRNIPNKYNQKMLVSTLEEGRKGHFDFIYLPIDFKNKCNVGYAFINMTRVDYIEPFFRAFHGKKWGRFNSEKVCEITFARIQGRQQLIAHFQNSSLLLEDPKCRPIIFDAMGRQEEFPAGSHVRTRRGPSTRDIAAARNGESTSPRTFSPGGVQNR